MTDEKVCPRQCGVCGKTFERHSARGIYCSTTCRSKAYWQKKKERMKS